MTTLQPGGAAAAQLAQRVLDVAARRKSRHEQLHAAERAEADAETARCWIAAALPGCATASRLTVDDPDRRAIHDRWSAAGRRSNLLLFGAPGRGKTYLASACAHTALQAGDRIACWRTSKLLRAIAGPAPDTHLLRTVTAAQVLLLDDPGLPPLTPHQAGVFLELVDDRHGRATLVATNLQPDQMRAAVTEPVYSRLTAGAIAVEIAGLDRRKMVPPDAIYHYGSESR